ncbi:MAG: hypothetical protein [Caudoviricetes sp.]|jgi:hypothetical protein|nr:MAG: hypothetical protein [Caudoviricetes sp.]
MDHFEVNDFVENEDGSATITVTMDYDTLLVFARKGILATLIESANKVVEEQETKE